MLDYLKDLLTATGTKGPFSSLGVMGPVVGMVVYVLNARYGAGVLPDADAVSIVQNLSLAFTGLTGVWGRIRAVKKVSGAPLV